MPSAENIHEPHDPLSEFLEEKYGDALELDLVAREMCRIADGQPAPRTLTDALEHYLRNHPKGESKRFARDVNRSIDLVVRVAGDLPIEAYRRSHAEAVRDAMLAEGCSTTTVRRRIRGCIAPVFADGIQAFDLHLARHPFQRLKIANEGKDAEKTIPFSPDDLLCLDREIRSHNDDIRQAIGLMLETGARLGEIIGLKRSNVILDGPVPYMNLQEHAERGLKSKQSIRQVPLVETSLWCARQALARGSEALGDLLHLAVSPLRHNRL